MLSNFKKCVYNLSKEGVNAGLSILEEKDRALDIKTDIKHEFVKIVKSFSSR